MARKTNTREQHRPRTVVVGAGITEYWFILHYENTNRFFGTSAKVIEALRKYLINYDKKDQFLRQEKWVMTMIDSNKLTIAYNRAKQLGHSGESYSDFWRAIDKMTH